MTITKYRTVEIIYPHLSLEVEVVDGDKKYYVNMDVNDKGEQELVLEDSWWAYVVPMDKVNFEHYDESIVDKDFSGVLNQMLKFWNANPVFINNLEWKEWECK